MPKQLTYSSLPDDYDPRIEEFFQFFSEFMAAQDTDATLMENTKKILDFYDKQPIDRLKKLTLSRWILYNKYPEYLPEFEAINTSYPIESRLNDKTGFLDKSLVNYYYKMRKDKHNEVKNILNASDFLRYRRVLFDRKINIQPTQFLWLLGRIESYSFTENGFKSRTSIKFKINRSLGGNYLQNKTIAINLPYIVKENQKLHDLNLNKESQYLIPVLYEFAVGHFPLTKNDILYYTFLPIILKVDNNRVSLNDNEELFEINKVWASLDVSHIKHYLFENKRSVTIDEADKIITDYINCKKLVE